MRFPTCCVTTVLLFLAPAVAGEEGIIVQADDKPHTNRLIDSLSPYLLQHAHNPVDWYPWSEEALEKARTQQKPIFLSIGYSACHWCHVMEHDCFESEEVAAILNEHFVSIKVDREERPDLDEIYMQATLALNQGHGGWPMSVFLKPDRVPFWAGTYIPRERFVHILEAIARAWQEDRGDIDAGAEQMQKYLQEWSAGARPAEGVPGATLRDDTARTLAGAFDMRMGGIPSGNNKFPPSMSMELILRSVSAGGDAALLDAVKVTLDRMADGGIYDHLGGGICRYSTDQRWLVPHFEKMLYDQALVSGIYLDGYQVFGNKRYADTARGIFDYVLADLQSPQGGFYSTRDADSEGLEGKYYIWTLEEVHKVLGEPDAALFCAYYDVTAAGNWNERFGHAPPGPKNILNVQRDLAAVAVEHGLTPEEAGRRLETMRRKLLEVRRQRVPPGLDDKILTAWNGLMVASLAKGARVLGEDRYAQAAVRAADFVLQHMRQGGRLLRTHRDGKSSITAFLNDYAFLIEGLLNLHEATFDGRWLGEAEALADVCARFYHDEQGGGFFMTASDGESMIARTKTANDGAIPSGNSVHAQNLLRLSLLLDRKDLREQAESIFRAFGSALESRPWGSEKLLCALDFYYGKTKEIALVAPDAGTLGPLVSVIYSRYLPNKVVVASRGGADDGSPLLRGKTAIEGRPTAYVCENYACKRPVQDAAALAALLWPQQASH